MYLPGDDIHFKELQKGVKRLQFESSAKGFMHSGLHLIRLCDLLIEDSEKYFEELCNGLLNKIKIEESSQRFLSTDFFRHIEGQAKNIFPRYLKILNDEIAMACKHDESRRQVYLKELSFEDRFFNGLQVVGQRYQAKYAEYIEQKELVKVTLEKSEQANQIAKASKRAAWCANLIALAALILAYLAYKNN